MKKNILLVAALFFIPFLTSAQVKKNKKDNKEKDNTQIFDERGGDIFKEKNIIDFRNVLKISPIDAIFGEYPIFYERVLNEKWSVEVGVGVNFLPVKNLNNLEARSLYRLYFPENVVVDKANPKPYVSANLRYFVNTRRNVAPEGVYFSVGTKWRQLSFNSHLDNESLPFDPDRRSTATHFDMLRLSVGKSNVGREGFYTDFSVGVAARRRTFSFWEYDAANNFEISPISDTDIVPAILLSAKIGIILK